MLRLRSCTARWAVQADKSAKQHGDRRVAPAAKRPFPQPVGGGGVEPREGLAHELCSCSVLPSFA